jgi:hypothetical protein
MDTQYLKENVGTALADGVAATLLANPHDPVEYLAHWLLKSVATQQNETVVRRKTAALIALTKRFAAAVSRPPSRCPS